MRPCRWVCSGRQAGDLRRCGWLAAVCTGIGSFCSRQPGRLQTPSLEADRVSLEPPEDEPQPSAEVRDRLTAWARARLDRLVLARAGDPGSVAGRRLTILEMENMIGDLTGSEIPIRDLLGQDTVGGEGFTNIGSAQSSMTASLLDKYLSAADRAVEHARFDELGRLVFDPPGQVASAQVREDASIIDLMVLNGRAMGSVFLGKGKSTTPGTGEVPSNRNLVAGRLARRRHLPKTVPAARVRGHGRAVAVEDFRGHRLLHRPRPQRP